MESTLYFIKIYVKLIVWRHIFFLQGCLCKLTLYVSLSTGMTFRQVFVENSELRSNTEAC